MAAQCGRRTRQWATGQGRSKRPNGASVPPIGHGARTRGVGPGTIAGDSLSGLIVNEVRPVVTQLLDGFLNIFERPMVGTLLKPFE